MYGCKWYGRCTQVLRFRKSPVQLHTTFLIENIRKFFRRKIFISYICSRLLHYQPEGQQQMMKMISESSYLSCKLTSVVRELMIYIPYLMSHIWEGRQLQLKSFTVSIMHAFPQRDLSQQNNMTVKFCRISDPKS